MSQVKWLPEALADIERLYTFIQEKSPAAAMRVAQTILEGADLLQSSPDLGRAMDNETGRRELVLPFGPGAYVLRYRLEGSETIVIIRVWHSRENRNL